MQLFYNSVVKGRLHSEKKKTLTWQLWQYGIHLTPKALQQHFTTAFHSSCFPLLTSTEAVDKSLICATHQSQHCFFKPLHPCPLFGYIGIKCSKTKKETAIIAGKTEKKPMIKKRKLDYSAPPKQKKHSQSARLLTSVRRLREQQQVLNTSIQISQCFTRGQPEYALFAWKLLMKITQGLNCLDSLLWE